MNDLDEYLRQQQERRIRDMVEQRLYQEKVDKANAGNVALIKFLFSPAGLILVAVLLVGFC